MTAVQPGTVRLIRPRHPFDGRRLPVLGSMRRHGAAELLVMLPDGSKRLIPVAWTDLESQPAGDSGGAPGTLGLVADLLRLCVLVSGLSARSTGRAEQAARKSPCLRSLPLFFWITGSGRNSPDFSARIPSKNTATPPGRFSTWATVAPSIPGVCAPALALTRNHASARKTGSYTRLNRSPNRREGSSPAQRCGLACISRAVR